MGNGKRRNESKGGHEKLINGSKEGRKKGYGKRRNESKVGRRGVMRSVEMD